MKPETQEDKEILEKLAAVTKAVDEGIDRYEFGPALHELYDFIWHDLADKYLELTKKREDDSCKVVLWTTLIGILKLLHPFMPFITEEIWHELPGEKRGLLMVEPW